MGFLIASTSRVALSLLAFCLCLRLPPELRGVANEELDVSSIIDVLDCDICRLFPFISNESFAKNES